MGDWILFYSLKKNILMSRIKEDQSLRLTEFNIPRNRTGRNAMEQFWAQLPDSINRRRDLEKVTLKAGIAVCILIQMCENRVPIS